MNIINQDAIRHLIQEAVNEAIEPHLRKLSSAPAIKPVYSVDEIIDMFKVSRRQLQHLRDSKQISYVQNGRKILFRAADIQEFIDKHHVSRRNVV